MIIAYPSHHRWVKPVISDPRALMGKKEQSRLRKTLGEIANSPIRVVFQSLNAEFLEQFMTLYDTRMATMKNPAHVDIIGSTLDQNEREYQSLALYDGDTFLGGTIFRIVNGELRIAYRVYEHLWRSTPYSASPSHYTEYCTATYAYEHGLTSMSHGKDRNPYGPNSSIGLAAFKLSVGCSPRLVRSSLLSSLDTDAVTEDMFVLEFPDNGEKAITHAYLIITRESEEKWMQVTKYPEQLTVSILYRHEVS